MPVAICSFIGKQHIQVLCNCDFRLQASVGLFCFVCCHACTVYVPLPFEMF